MTEAKALADALRADFPEGYWTPFYEEFQHNFFDMHVERTIAYDRLLGDRLRDQAVLEVGGYPGLMASWLLKIGCRLTTMESPDYVPEWYGAWLRGKGLTYIVHDIIQGRPSFCGFWNWITLSDVLIHMNGIPMAFLAWAASCSDRILLSNWRGDRDELEKATSGTLKNTWEMPKSEAISGAMAALGMRLEDEIDLGPRVILIYKNARRERGA